MADILIAYNSDYKDKAHNLFESCADKAKQISVNNGKSYTPLTTPDFTSDRLMSDIVNHHLCVIAAHGDAEGIYNENGDDVITVHTTNCNCAGKGIYSISCSCAANLCEHLMGIGAKFFVGYNRPFRFTGEIEPFIDSSMSGLNALLSGQDVKATKEEMLNVYDTLITESDPNTVTHFFLVHNKESLLFAGDEHCCYQDLV